MSHVFESLTCPVWGTAVGGRGPPWAVLVRQSVNGAPEERAVSMNVSAVGGMCLSFDLKMSIYGYRMWGVGNGLWWN